MRILLVEDEKDAAKLLARCLRDHTFAVDTASDGNTAIEKVFVNAYDLILLDVMLPDIDGFMVCREVRRMGSRVPILMLTALDQARERIRGLDTGADDYLGKPFALGELFARIRALLRRAPILREPMLRVADLTVDTHHHVVRRGERVIEMTAKEYALLECLALRAGAVVGRAEISEHVWDETYDPTSNLIEVYIQRVRRKVDLEGLPRLLHTRRGEGYQLTLPEDSGV